MIKSEDPRLEYMSLSNKNNLAVYLEMTKKNKFMNETVNQYY